MIAPQANELQIRQRSPLQDSDGMPVLDRGHGNISDKTNVPILPYDTKIAGRSRQELKEKNRSGRSSCDEANGSFIHTQVAQPPQPQGQGERASAGEDLGCNLNLSDDLQDEDVDIQATQAHRSHEIIEIDEPCAKRILVKAHRSTFSFQWKLLDLMSSPHSDLPQEAHFSSASSALLIINAA
eukprot:scaffold4786_cov103-Skeletonema_marinoi.AAC.1